MVNYESLLLGGGSKRGCGMTYEDRLKNLKKARAVRAKNLAEKKKYVTGKGQYNQDYVDESQNNYAGSPLDMYYLASPKEMEHEKEERGEIGMGAKRRGRKPKVMKECEGEEMEGGAIESGVNIPDAIKVLGILASKFGLKLSK